MKCDFFETLGYSKLCFFIVLIIIFISDDTLLFGTVDNKTIISIKYVVYIMVTFYLFYMNRKSKFSLGSKKLLLFFAIVYCVFLMIYHQDVHLGYFYRCILLILCALIVKQIRIEDFTTAFVNIMYVISVYSLITYFLNLVLPSLFNWAPLMFNISGIEFRFLGLNCILDTGLRNTGIFREPGMFSIYLLFAITIEIFNKERYKKNYFLIFIITLITTYSTAGFFALGVILFCKYVLMSHSILGKTFGLMLLLFSIALVLSSDFISVLVFNKLGKGIDNESTFARVASLVVPLVIFSENIFFGTGISNFSAALDEYSIKLFGLNMDDQLFTNTITLLLVTCGLLGVIYLIGLLRFATVICKNKKYNIFVIFLLAIFFSNENMPYSLLYNLIVVYGLSLNCKSI